jgi:small subunit ribosomal protein S20
MANIKSAAKRARQTIRRTKANRRVRNAVKRSLKNVRASAQAGDTAKVPEKIRAAVSTLDKAAKTGRIHKNKANRQKSRLAKLLAAK